jgi:NAD(P)-dependent dehydrogenase (short-subunit alcohol dehydrogenase family)
MHNVVDINLNSVLSFSRLALAYMKASPACDFGTPQPQEQKQEPLQNERQSNFLPLTPTTSNTSTTAPVNIVPASPPPFTRSITLVSSIAGITPAPGLPSYSASKHGVIGLARSLAAWAPIKYNGVRTNVICPWATDTQLLAGFTDVWRAERLPMNAPLDVARMILQCAVDGRINGAAVFVGGGRGWDVEEGLTKTRKVWLGDLWEEWERGQIVLGTVSLFYSLVFSWSPFICQNISVFLNKNLLPRCLRGPLVISLSLSLSLSFFFFFFFFF